MKKIKKQYIYVISNPTHSWYKVGISKDAKQRCLNMQTGCPFRGYKIKAYLFKHPKLKQEIIDWMIKDVDRGDIKYFQYFGTLFKEHRFAKIRGFYGVDFVNKKFKYNEKIYN